MKDKPFDINSLRVASPCSVGWETMAGDERVRHCASCQLNVYNVSAITTVEARDLIMQREGRLCIRLYRRADGTVVTADCPVGLRAVRKRTARFATATLSAIIGLFSVSFAQKENKNEIDAKKAKIVRTRIEAKNGQLVGTLTDLNGAVIPGAVIRIWSDDQWYERTTDAEGEYRFYTVEAGKYRLSIRSTGFKAYELKNLEIQSGEKLNVDVRLLVDSEIMVTVGILAGFDEISIDPTSPTVQTTITQRKIRLIPHE